MVEEIEIMDLITGKIISSYKRHQSEQAKRKISEGNKGKLKSEEHKKHIREARAKQVMKPRSEEVKKKISETQIGKFVSEETKEKIRVGRAKQVMKPHSEETKRKMSLAKIGHSTSVETRKNMSIAQKVRFSLETKEQKVIRIEKAIQAKKPCSEETREKLRIARAKQTLPKENSSPEKKVQAWLTEQGIPYQTQVHIQGLLSKPYGRHPWDVMLLIPDTKTLIEVQGCYWHWCPMCHPGSLPEPTTSQNKRILANLKRDKIIFAEARSKGWKVIEIWEHTINNKTIQFKI
jgi:G:T-mismatch repair DNA endonuclease (very short patch repair protein)